MRARTRACDYIESHMYGEFCDVTKYTMATNGYYFYKQAIVYSSPYFVRGVI